MISFKTLENTAIEDVYAAFSDAFSDYVVSLSLPLQSFKNMMQRRGFVPSVSIGAFSDDSKTPVGIVLNGLRDWNGILTAYDVGTGVSPNFRRQGITSQMFDKGLEILSASGANQYLLEVIKKNTVAFELYKKLGFEVVRSFSCFKSTQEKESQKSLPTDVYITQTACFNKSEFDKTACLSDASPSWQNSNISVAALEENFNYYLVRHNYKTIGFGIADKKSGDIAQIAIKKEFRRRGIGTFLLKAMRKGVESGNLAALNVDDDFPEINEFFLANGFENHVDQYEMIKKI